MSKGQYKSTKSDLRFIELVEIVIAKQKETGKKPDNQSQISEKVFGDITIISKIRAGKRGISRDLLEKFGKSFNINFNWFFGKSENVWLDDEVNPEHERKLEELEKKIQLAKEENEKIRKEKEELSGKYIKMLEQRS